MPLEVRPFQEPDQQAWDAFVHEHPIGTPFHLTAWKRSIEDTFGYQSCYLGAWEGRELRAVLPLFLVSNFGIFRRLISSPFAVYGGVLSHSEDAKTALAARAAELGRELGVRYIEVRNQWPEQSLGWQPLYLYVNFTQEIASDPEAILQQIPRKTRYIVRRSQRYPLYSRAAPNLTRFEDLYSENLRRLGTPSFPSAHFVNLQRHFGDKLDVHEILLNGEVAGAVLTIYFRDQVLPYYGASDPIFNEAAPSSFMYYDQMCRKAAEGYRRFDFGRSRRDSGSYHFKAHWGMVERELPYEVLLVRQKQLPSLHPDNPRVQWAIKLWQRLPLPVTRLLGPRLIKLVP